MGSLSDKVIEELSEVDSENLIDIVSDRETLKAIIVNFIDTSMIEVIDENVLLPEYLMMWFRRTEFDRVCGKRWNDLYHRKAGSFYGLEFVK